MASIKQVNYSLDMTMSTVSTDDNIFEYNVESGLASATSITIQNVVLSNVTYTAVPAWYDATNKYLYSAVTGENYWEVDGDTLTFVDTSDS